MKLDRKILLYKRYGPVWLCLCLFISILLVLYDSNEVNSQEKSLTVAIKTLSPCVMETEGQYTGFDVELWEQIAKDLKLEFNYRLADQWGIFSDLVEGNADIAFSCMPITHEWEETVDFSHHYLESGLRILVLNKSTFSMKQTLKSIFSPLVLTTLGALLIFIIICGNAVWFVEKGGRIISNRLKCRTPKWDLRRLRSVMLYVL